MNEANVSSQVVRDLRDQGFDGINLEYPTSNGGKVVLDFLED